MASTPNACFKEMAAKMSSYTYTELFRAQIEYSVGDAYTMMALSFRKMISGHVQGPYGEPKFVPIKGYGSVGDEQSFIL